MNDTQPVATSPDDTAKIVRMTIADVIYNKGIGLSRESCEELAQDIMDAVSAVESL